MPSALALVAHPDDIEFIAAGTLLLLHQKGWDIHYCNISNGDLGSTVHDRETTARIRLQEAALAARHLGATFHPPVATDLAIFYDTPTLRKIAAIIRASAPSIVLTHSPSDYMEDHMNTARLAVTAAFTKAMPNFETDPPLPMVPGDVTIYHGMPHGLQTPLRQRVRAHLYVDTTSVHQRKREALALHASQKEWLDHSQGHDSYLVAMDNLSREVGALSGSFSFAEGWRRHLHLGYSSRNIDPLAEALAESIIIDELAESDLTNPR